MASVKTCASHHATMLPAIKSLQLSLQFQTHFQTIYTIITYSIMTFINIPYGSRHTYDHIRTETWCETPSWFSASKNQERDVGVMLGVLTCKQSFRWQSLTKFELAALQVRIQLACIFMLLSFIWICTGCLALNVRFFSPWTPVTSAEAWQFCSVSALRLAHPALPDHWQPLVALACKLRWPENCGLEAVHCFWPEVSIIYFLSWHVGKFLMWWR